MRTKVLHLINSLEMGGAENQLLLLLKFFDKKNFDWHLATLHKNSSLLKNYNNKEIFINDFSKKGKPSLFGLLKLYKYIKKNKIDIVHTHLVHAGLLGFVIGRLAGVKIFFYTRHHTLSNKEESFLYKLLLHVLKRYTKVICVSKSVYDHFILKELPKDKLQIVYNAVNPLFFNTSQNNLIQPNSVISVGRLVEPKGYKNLIDAIKIVKEKVKDVKCFIVGEGPLYGMLSEKIKINKLEQSVFLTGQKSIPAVISLVREKEIYVCSSEFEGFNLALVEAMALGKATISTPVGIAPEIIKNGGTGVLIKNNSAYELAIAISNLLKDSLFKKECEKTAPKIIEKLFNVKKITKSLQELYIEECRDKNNCL